LRKQQAEAGDIVLLYGDESEALTHPYLARAWAKAGADLRVPAPGQAKKVAMLGSLDHVTRRLIVHTSPTKRSSDFVAHLEQLDRLYGPRPGQPTKPVVLVEDNGPIHTSRLSMAALADRTHWLTVEWLPKYAPELNDIDVVWHDLKAHHLAHQTLPTLTHSTGRSTRPWMNSMQSEWCFRWPNHESLLSADTKCSLPGRFHSLRLAERQKFRQQRPRAAVGQ
jgi:transposase